MMDNVLSHVAGKCLYLAICKTWHLVDFNLHMLDVYKLAEVNLAVSSKSAKLNSMPNFLAIQYMFVV